MSAPRGLGRDRAVALAAIDVHIERLVVDGIAPVDAHQLGSAVARALESKLGGRRANEPMGGPAVVNRPPTSHPPITDIGERIAEAVHRRIGLVVGGSER